MTTLSHLRKSRNMTQQKLAQKLHMTQYDVCLIERNERLPWPREAQLICDYFGVKIQALFPGELRQREKVGGGYDASRIYMPPDGSAPLPCPPRFSVACWRCGSPLHMDTPGAIPKDAVYECPACTAQFMVSPPSTPTPRIAARPPKQHGHWHGWETKFREGVRA